MLLALVTFVALPVAIPLLPVIVLSSIFFGTRATLRWPLLAIVGAATCLDLAVYFMIRYVVLFLEWSLMNRPFCKIRGACQDAQTYDEWVKAAREADRVTGWESFKKDPHSEYYNWRLIDKMIADIRECQEQEDVERLQILLSNCLHKNFGGILNEPLYQETHIGTKYIIEEFVTEVNKALKYVEKAPEALIKNKDKQKFLKHARMTFGRTALCLSGGGGLGHYHFGMVRAMLEAGCLPHILSGTSAGAVVCAVLGTRTDEELLETLKPEMYENMTCFNDSYADRISNLWKYGTLFNPNIWLEKIKWHASGNMTFLEAYEKTGRIINLTATPSGNSRPPLLMNYLLTPHVTIGSAVVASSAVPGLVPSVNLLEKDSKGNLRPYHGDDTMWRDGAFTTDLPLQALGEMFNVSYFIVSQLNPHIAPFFYNSRGEAGGPSVWRKHSGGWRGGFLLSAMELYLKEDMRRNMRVLGALDLLPAMFGFSWSLVFLQDFEGNLTMVPPLRIRDYLRIISDPTYEDEAHYLHQGELVAWQKMSLLKNRISIGQQLVMSMRAVGLPSDDPM
eukprot:Clim_evm35s158 gene=Clim_evmTU35s158